MTMRGERRIRQGLSYREVFFAHNGPGPYECFFECERGTVDADEVYVHHEDHNRSHNGPENLKASHPGCHAGYHAADIRKGVPLSEDHKAAIKAGLAKCPRAPWTPEQFAQRAETRRRNAAAKGKIW